MFAFVALSFLVSSALVERLARKNVSEMTYQVGCKTLTRSQSLDVEV